MTSENHYNRRTLLKTAAGGVTGSLLVSNLSSAAALQSGRIKGTSEPIRLQMVLQRNVGRATGARSGPDWSQVGRVTHA
jgi:hypothetical protein